MQLRAFLLPVLCALAGCANSPTPLYDAKFGEAVREARARMAINPAGVQGDAAGMDGRSAREAVNLYQRTFREPPPVINVINIGGASSAAK